MLLKLYSTFGLSVISYHGDNGIFSTQAFKNDCCTKGRTFSLSGFGAHHQNGEFEKFYPDFHWFLLLHAIYWPEAADLQLWPFALQPSIPLEHSF